MAGFDDETLLRTLADAVSNPPASDSGGGEATASVEAEAAKLLSAVGQEDEIEAAKVLSGVGPEEEAEQAAEHGFSVGDLVWGKIKSHPWWPGQIYDPRQASKLALKFNQKGRLLVAYFGDDSFAWCLPSQLIPFAEHFEDMSKQSSSIVFLTAVQEAVAEVERHVEMGMVCNHVGGEGRKEIETPMSKNAGIQEGVPMPQGDLAQLFSARYPSAEFLAAVKGFAVGASFPNPLELGILKGFLSAFNRHRGGGVPLAVCYEGIMVEGLEDPSKSGVLVKNDALESTEAAPGGPQEEDWSSTVSSFKRKQKSVAEILGEGSEENVKTGGKLKSALTTGEKRGRKLIQNGENAGEEAAPPKVLTIQVNGDGTDENATEGMKVSAEIASPRERKKSKYLSPPYTNPQFGAARLEKESESASVKVAKVGVPKEGLEQESAPINKSPRVGESMTRAAGILLQTPPSGVQTPSVGKTGPRKVKPAPMQEKKIEASDVNVSPNKVLEVVASMAGTPKNLLDEDMVSTVRGFLATFRSCSYRNGEHYKTFRKLKGGKKGKSGEENGDGKSSEVKLKKRKSGEENGDGKSSEAKLKKRKSAEENGDAKSSEAKLKKPAKRSVVKLNEKKVQGNAVAGNGHSVVERLPLQQLDSVRQKLEVIASMVEKCDGKISKEEATNLETETEMLHDKVRKMSEAV